MTDEAVLDYYDEQKCDIIRGTFSTERLKYPFYKTLTRVTVLIPGIVTPSILKKLETHGIHAEYKNGSGDTMLYFTRTSLPFHPSKWIDLTMAIVLVGIGYYSMLLLK